MIQLWAPATQFGQLLIELLIVSGTAVLLCQSMLTSRFLAKKLAAHREAVHEQLEGFYAASGPAPTPGPCVILVVEDDGPMLELTTAHLTSAGYVVRGVASAEAAVVSLASGQALPDLIVLDIRLPGMSGLELAKQLRWAGCRMPILGYSGLGNAEQRAAAVASGCNAFVAKDANGAALVVAVERWLGLSMKLQRFKKG